MTTTTIIKTSRIYDTPSKKRGGWLVGDLQIGNGKEVAMFEIIIREVVFQPWETDSGKREILCFPSLLDEQDCETISVHPHQCIAFLRFLGLTAEWAQDMLDHLGLRGAYRISSEQAACYSAGTEPPSNPAPVTN